MNDFQSDALTSSWRGNDVLSGDFWSDRFLLGGLRKRALHSVLIFGLAPLAILLCARYGDVLSQPSPSVGFLQDYVMLGFFVATPVQLYILLFCSRKFAEFFRGLPRVLRQTRFQLDEYNKEVGEILSLVQGEGKGRVYYRLLLLGGAVAFLVNASALFVRPGAWNSGSNLLTYSASQLYFLVILVLVYPSLAYKFLGMIYGISRICRTVKQRRAFRVWPLAPDGAGGLRKLGDVTIALNYFLVPYVVLMILQRWTNSHIEGVVSFGFLIGVVSFVPVQVASFFLPLSAAHDAMKESKEEIIEMISVASERANRAMVEKLSEGNQGSNTEVMKIEEEMSSLRRMYDIAAELPIWPFDARIIGKLISNILLPATGTIFAMLTERFLAG